MRTSSLRSTTTTLIALSLIAFTMLTGAAFANAAATCYGSTCTGQDPNARGCAADARTLAEYTYSARFELRYSPACHAAWTRVTSATTYNTIFAQINGYTTKPTSIGAPAARTYGAQVVAGQTWTAMVSFDYWVRGCTATWFTATPHTCTGTF
ncbi:DUF2690 domain-containing protein [Saccharothrix saharensis]|uniref:DUF2690 domain-containing protein n=1 Tax=Saccharothrix saharensis TaxID=571190 RepID=UPI0036C503EB